ncbi:efflux RND transporter periplasmic adaptor subunit, partial [Bacteroidota bacterium]
LIPINFKIENNGDFLPGSIIEVFIKTKTNQKSILVPNSALIEEQGNYFVFVQITPEMFEKREVKIGTTDGNKTEIISGLKKKERIVSKGAIIVKLAAVSNSLDPHAGHVH